MADNEEIIERRASTAAMARLERAITSLTGQFASNNSSASSSGGGGGAAAPSFGIAGGAPSPPRFSNYTDRQNFTKILTSFGNGALGFAGAVAMALPTTQEAVDVQALANRMRFYGGSSKGNNFYNTEAKAMKAQLQTSLMGTATSPEDAALASNYAAQRGLMPGLANFGAGKNYTGIMGGAALASNLTPGLGITGGVGVMAGLNDPKLVNMSRMFGIQTRNKEGTGMVDLPQIIKQLYDILAKAGPVTPENIAISAMPGNALDSILNQYFGLDPNVRSTVLAGITQLAKNKGSVRSLTNKASLTKSGASTDAIASTGFRASTELSLLQAYAGRTTTNLIGTNNVLNDIYKGVAKTATGKGTSDKAVQIISNLSTMLETFGGARNGAGQLLVDTMFDLTGDVTTGAFKGLQDGSFYGKGLSAAGLGLGAYGTYKLNQKFSNSFAKGAVNDPLGLGPETGVTPTNPGKLFTGAITINVSAPLGQDPYAFASAITKSLSAAM